MGTDDLFHKHSEENRKQLRRIREERGGTWLIVCEGEKTEPNYFRGVESYLRKELGSTFKLKFQVEGDGRNTQSLVRSADPFLDYTDSLKRKSSIPFARTFVVLDRDSFLPSAFDNAIFMAESKDYIPLWSNECFELWYLLHFGHYQSDNGRKDYFNLLDEKFLEAHHCKYQKNQINCFELLHEKLPEAYHNAAKRYVDTCGISSPAARIPCTTVFQFFDLLNEEIERQTGEKEFLFRAVHH